VNIRGSLGKRYRSTEDGKTEGRFHRQRGEDKKEGVKTKREQNPAREENRGGERGVREYKLHQLRGEFEEMGVEGGDVKKRRTLSNRSE